MCNSGKAELTVSLYVRRPLLAEATGLPQSSLVFGRDAKGKLSLVSDQSWCFNLADTPGCVVLVVARHQAVGVDIESVDRAILNLDDFAAAFLSPVEQKHVLSLDESAKKSWVLKAWVLKEAYTKQLGMGLSYGFERITVDPDAEQPLIAIDGNRVDSPDYLVLWPKSHDYYMAVSAQGLVDGVYLKSLDQVDFEV